MKVVVAIGGLLLLALVGYYTYFPTLQENRHAANYERLDAYLQKTYPEVDYIIHNKPPLEEGGYIYEFQVSRTDSATSGLIYHVDGDDVSEYGHWSNEPYPTSKENVWKQQFYHDIRPLDELPVQAEKVDMLEHNGYLIFALDVDGVPYITIYDYSSAALSQLVEQAGETGQPLTVEYEGSTYTFVPNDADVATNGTKGKVSIQ